MDVYTKLQLVVRLEQDERFDIQGKYGNEEPKVRAESLRIVGDSVWIKGPAYTKDGKLGTRIREVLVEPGDLPIVLVVRLFTHMLGAEV